jgi:translation initiation factor 2 gamma subunit (eIF-2gamma)
VDYFRDTRVHDSFWTMKLNDPVTTTDPVTLSVSRIVCDRWQLVAVEVPGNA